MITAIWLTICQHSNTIYHLQKRQQSIAHGHEYQVLQKDIEDHTKKRDALFKDLRNVMRLTKGTIHAKM